MHDRQSKAFLLVGSAAHDPGRWGNRVDGKDFMTDLQKITLACIRACCDSIKADNSELTEYQDEWLNDIYSSLLQLQKEIVFGIHPADKETK